MFETVSYIIKYIFVLIIYLFIFGIMRLVYLDIKSMRSRNGAVKENKPYLKLLNQRELLNFKVEEVYTLDKNLSLGRTSDNDIALDDPFLSKKHAMFTVRESKIYLEDLNSRNGTFLNGNRLNMGVDAQLTDGDKISMGNVEFLFIKAPGGV
jgi:hypothetical protein